MDFDFKGKAVHRAVNDIVQTDDNGSVGNVSDNGAATQTPAGGYDHTRVNRACYRDKSAILLIDNVKRNGKFRIVKHKIRLVRVI